MYEPVHGTAPDIAGQNKANPLATILSVAMMFRYSLDQPLAAELIEQAVASVLAEGYRTGDIANAHEMDQMIGTQEMGERVLEQLG
jgi:3-isopropylmalate dehydrogenase